MWEFRYARISGTGGWTLFGLWPSFRLWLVAVELLVESLEFLWLSSNCWKLLEDSTTGHMKVFVGAKPVRA
jgi:hypothetical protein